MVWYNLDWTTGGVTAQPSVKEVIDAMVAFGVLYLILKLTDTLLNLWFKGRKFYRWIRLKRNKQKTHR
ncbi:hypothetical protein UY286_08525 [Paenibacillus polymyxa]|uniref:hypothetical protein n=1 Tax=Paenibacillus polymyxa TaxID=1406 RepID=UPI002AB56EE0|nr:hypothetical protein [Paenibacillus polymyxa]MDY7990707.1 hypothetical protein [Paenibacillus polymyxa]MDY8117482.1 hypothetical protein [Paenibacillus polymyxa]